MSAIACPHCHGAMDSPPELAGKWVACPLCRQQFVMPDSHFATSANYGVPAVASNPFGDVNQGYQQHYGPAGYPQRDVLSGIKVPILVSGIMNAIVAVIWLFTCFGVIVTIPLSILCIFEFIYFSSADQMPRQKAIGDGRTLAIFEIVLGVLFLNMVSLVCGIIALVNANQADRQWATGGLG